MSEPKHYTALDIERYHRGEMPPAEMHRLEKAALDDPFLADMLEGYLLTPSAPADLQSLRKKLRQRIEKDERKTGAVFPLQWLKVAAVLLLVAAAGWLVLQTFSTNAGKMAVSKESEINSGTPNRQDSGFSTVQTITPSLQTDSISTMNDVAVNNRNIQERQGPVSRQQRLVTESNAAPETAGEANDHAAGISALKADEQKSDSTASVAELGAASSAPAVSAASDTIRNVDVVLKPLDIPLTEVVVARKMPTAKRRSQPTVLLDTLEPVQGWAYFDDYIAENLKAPEELKEKRAVEAEVELSFDVNKKGNAIHITVTKSLCSKCDTEAVRLLKEGPKWKGKKGKVKIKFPQSP